ncbi:hypothetical protein M514_01185 [Trichuris suis]|uniref:Uncharacterized protein n=1 Tax=Trichuris suis TaxID=68888 RepID=A0A085NN20_9BILA|nr:hypothetical protein M513_01185 [Trichuris suis]KFD70866.1 hypothetical protein M514_01185 [Trichuris suis]
MNVIWPKVVHECPKMLLTDLRLQQGSTSILRFPSVTKTEKGKFTFEPLDVQTPVFHSGIKWIKRKTLLRQGKFVPG